MYTAPPATTLIKMSLRAALLLAALGVAAPSHAFAQGARGGRGSVRGNPPSPKPAPARASQPAVGGAWSMPDQSDLVEHVIRRIVTQDKPAAIPINDFRQRAFGRAATLAAVRAYLGRSVELPASVFASVSDWTDAPDKLPVPDCPAADSTCATPSTVWLAVTKFERGDLPHEMNVWYTTSFIAKPHDQIITSRYAFCERWLRVGGTWKYDGFIRVVSG
jgi:hypothetical protein